MLDLTTWLMLINLDSSKASGPERKFCRYIYIIYADSIHGGHCLLRKAPQCCGGGWILMNSPCAPCDVSCHVMSKVCWHQAGEDKELLQAKLMDGCWLSVLTCFLCFVQSHPAWREYIEVVLQTFWTLGPLMSFLSGAWSNWIAAQASATWIN